MMYVVVVMYIFAVIAIPHNRGPARTHTYTQSSHSYTCALYIYLHASTYYKYVLQVALQVPITSTYPNMAITTPTIF